MAASPETATSTGLAERQRVIDELRRREHELRARGLTRLALFGSTARGDMGPQSDVDLLIEVDPERGFGLFALLDLKDHLAGLLGRRVDLAFATRCVRACAPPCCRMRSRCSDDGAARSSDRPRTDAGGDRRHRADHG